MEMIYNFIRFQQSVRPDKNGDTKRIYVLLDILDNLCRDLGGHLVSGGLPSSNILTRQVVEQDSEYLIGTCWVKNNVNLAGGKMTTDVGYLENYEDSDLIEKLKSLYGERNMYRGLATHQRKIE